LHHLPDPDAGFRALSEALAPEGGMGLMVYAPLGRSGVYPLQEGFGTLFTDDAPETQVALAQEVLERLSPAHPFARNALVGDHKDGDAGLYDLLLHSRDRPYTVTELSDALARADLGLVAFLEHGRYDPVQYLPRSSAFKERLAKLDPMDRAALAEQISGNMKTHIVYATRAGREQTVQATGRQPQAVPHLRGVASAALAQQVKAKGGFTLTSEGLEYRVELSRRAAPLIAQIDGRAPLEQIARSAGLDWMAFMQIWGPVSRELTAFNLLHYSKSGRA
ncbi:MAG: class I SAM-dependent methyltransferase, partial [Pseudomonadota bacterium]